jgi:hypothetical protein
VYAEMHRIQTPEVAQPTSSQKLPSDKIEEEDNATNESAAVFQYDACALDPFSVVNSAEER